LSSRLIRPVSLPGPGQRLRRYHHIIPLLDQFRRGKDSCQLPGLCVYLESLKEGIALNRLAAIEVPEAVSRGAILVDIRPAAQRAAEGEVPAAFAGMMIQNSEAFDATSVDILLTAMDTAPANTVTLRSAWAVALTSHAPITFDLIETEG